MEERRQASSSGSVSTSSRDDDDVRVFLVPFLSSANRIRLMVLSSSLILAHAIADCMPFGAYSCRSE